MASPGTAAARVRDDGGLVNHNAPLGNAEDQQVTDRVTIAALAAGDPAALDVLYTQYATLVITIIQRIVRDRRIAEELLQEVFLRIWQHGETYQPDRGPVRSWILGVARNLALNELRRQRRRPATLSPPVDPAMPDDPMGRIPDPGPQPDEIAWLRERRELLASALGQLPDVQRSVIDLYAVGYSQSEIASRLNEPLGTVKTRMRRGLIRLRDILPDLEPGRNERME